MGGRGVKEPWSSHPPSGTYSPCNAGELGGTTLSEVSQTPKDATVRFSPPKFLVIKFIEKDGRADDAGAWMGRGGSGVRV